ncbi:hypothetical protein BJF77_05355 [Kocuria sp. CNJ-770]|jgi:hypothetical protein|uniref:Uncharacterized protein n=1 Tax=Kocuria oceani TaxID=988827 RepID=A0ABV9TKG2_9MICC|nr:MULTISPECIES: hypothetical protein [Kocuria]OLT13777.1 hypothetical protein BJF77_05355 [Kocuria sp. CNJ-770]
MHHRVRIVALVVLLLALGLFAVTEWLPALYLVPAAGGTLLVNEYGARSPGPGRRERDRPRP